MRELEIAFAQVKRDAEVPAPWITDRLFRNILVDMTGNTHRTEFCIDKMYSPDSSSGRLGLVEFRAFEMPPHPEMAAAQTLLMRTAVAAFWQVPYERRLVRWGTRVHDDFMLPHYVWQDFTDALEELQVHGAGFGACARPGMVRAPFDLPFPGDRRGGGAPRHHGRVAPRVGAVARAGRGLRRQRHGALRGTARWSDCRRG